MAESEAAKSEGPPAANTEPAVTDLTNFRRVEGTASVGGVASGKEKASAEDETSVVSEESLGWFDTSVKVRPLGVFCLQEPPTSWNANGYPQVLKDGPSLRRFRRRSRSVKLHTNCCCRKTELLSENRSWFEEEDVMVRRQSWGTYHRTGPGRMAGIGLLAMAGIGCGDSSVGPAPDETPITIAAAVSQSGRFETLGSALSAGYRLAVDMLNERGGIRGREMNLILLDDGSDSETSARIFGEFVAADTIDALVGPYPSTITAAVLPVTEAGAVPLVASTASSPDLWEGQSREWSIQVLNPAPTYLRGVVELGVVAGAQTVALTWEDAPFTASVARGVRTAVDAAGLQMVFDESHQEGTDYGAIVAAAQTAGADLFVGGVYDEGSKQLTRAAAAAGYRPLLSAFTIGPGRATWGEEIGPAGVCVVGSTPWRAGVQTSGFIATSDAMVERLRENLGGEPSYHSAAGFASVEILAEAIDHSIEMTGEVDRTAIRDYLFGSTTRTVLGAYGVHPLDTPQAGVQRALESVLVQWQEDGAGGLVSRIIHPQEVAEAPLCLNP